MNFNINCIQEVVIHNAIIPQNLIFPMNKLVKMVSMNMFNLPGFEFTTDYQNACPVQNFKDGSGGSKTCKLNTKDWTVKSE